MYVLCGWLTHNYILSVRCPTKSQTYSPERPFCTNLGGRRATRNGVLDLLGPWHKFNRSASPLCKPAECLWEVTRKPAVLESRQRENVIGFT
jgi:hypothetical protein